MATETKKAEASCSSCEPRTWPVSLLGCLQGTSSTKQSPWPWLLFKACFCPASVLGVNETMFQGEEPADICCLQPYSACGPTCRGLNAELCGLGNEGLKLCAHTCILQLACSCMCLGLPYVAWLAALQRQRVMAKHGLAVTNEEAWATACYPCSLLQMHALLQQQYQQQQGLLHSHHSQQQQQTASVPLRAPRVQQMTASEAPSQASSLPGPLTSAMTTSKVMRTVRDHSTRSEGTAVHTAGPGGSMRQGLRDSQADDDSSEASETGVVNSPMLDKQQRPSDALEQGSESARSRGDLSARNNSSRDDLSGCNNSSSRRTSARTSSDEAGGSQRKQRQQAPSSVPFLRPPPPAAQPSQPQLGPLMSARSHSSNGGHQHMLPPRPGMTRHSGTVSLGGNTAADAAAAAAVVAGGGRGSDSCVPAPGTELITPEPSSSGIVRSNKRKLPGRAAAASQSCHLPNGFHSSSRLPGAQDNVPSTPPQASSSGMGAGAGMAAPASAGPAFGGNSSSAAGQPGTLSASIPGGRMHSSCSKASIGGSCSRLVAFSQEDVPLSAFKPNPGGSNSTRASLGASATDLSKSAGGWGYNSSKAGSLASSMQQQQQQEFFTPVYNQRPNSSGAGGSSSGGADNSTPHQQQQHQHQQLRKVSEPGMEASPAGLAALVLSNPRSSYRMRPDPQYATMQSDICNFASWLGEAPAGLNVSSMQPNQQQPGQEEGAREFAALHQQEQQHEQQEEQQRRQQETPQPLREQETPQPQRSEGDMCNFGEPMSPADACSPKQALSHKAQDETTNAAAAAAADKDAATTASTAAAAAGSQGRVTAAANSNRPAVLAAAWAYMSDMCNLGGSFDVAASAIGRSGLAAAVLSRLAAENSSTAPQASAAAAAGQRPSSSDGSSDGGSKHQPGIAAAAAAAAAAAGSWPDTAPSPPFATLASGGTFSSEDAAAMAAGNHTDSSAQQQSSASKLPALLPAAAAAAAGIGEGDVDEVSSPPRRRRRGADGGACPNGSGSDASASPAAAGSGASDLGSSSSRDGQQRAQPRAGGMHGLDPEMLAAVTGKTSRDELTASQEELAAKLARLAFANPNAARQLAGAQQQQQHRGSSAGGQRQTGRSPLPQLQQQQQFEPFYPTMMSDICNLADPQEDEQQQQQQQMASRENSQSIVAGRLSGAGATGAAATGPGQQQQSRAGDGANMRPPPGRPPVPPQSAAAAAAARGPPGQYSRQPNLPGRPVRQQDQQQQYTSAATSRLGWPPTCGVMQQPGSNAAAAVAAAGTAAGSGDTAGPLRAALLLRGMRGAPGGPQQGSPAAAAAGGAAGPMGRRAACPGDASGGASASRLAGGEMDGPYPLGAAPHLAHLQQGHRQGHSQGQGQYPGQDSFASFDSFYVDCDLPPHAPEPHCAAVEAANMITNNPLYTLTASENGGTADSVRFTPALKQQLRNPGAAAAAAGGSGSGGGGSSAGHEEQQHQQGGSVSGGAASSTPAATAAAAVGGAVSGGNVAAIVAVFEGRSSSNSDHDDTGPQQLDNSRSNSPAPMFVGDGAVYAAAGTAAGGEKGSGKGAARVCAGRGDAGGLGKSAGALHASGGSLRARQLQYGEYDAADRD